MSHQVEVPPGMERVGSFLAEMQQLKKKAVIDHQYVIYMQTIALHKMYGVLFFSARGHHMKKTKKKQKKSKLGTLLTCFIDKTLCLFLHPFLIIILYIFFMLSSTAVGLPH